MRKFKPLITLFFILIQSCEFSEKNYFPSAYGHKWLYSVVIQSSYTGKSSKKRVMVTNFHEEKKKNVK